MPVLNSRSMVGILLPACSAIALLLVSTFTFAQSPSNSAAIPKKDSVKIGTNPLIHTNGVSDKLGEKTIQPGTDQDGAHVLNRLNGVITDNQGGSSSLSTLHVFGLGERYNQLLFNGAPLPSFDPTMKAWPLGLIQAEAIEEASVQRTGDAATPADYAGGSVSIRTRDMPDQNFFYIRLGSGFSDATNGKDFYSDKLNSWEWLSFPGSSRNLPSSFPTTHSSYSFDQLNPQEQVARSKSLKNNLAPVNNGSAKPNDKVLLGYGKIIQFKNGRKLGILALINHQGTERIDQSTVQAAPNISALYPIADGTKPLIQSLSNDNTYRYLSQLGATLNASLLFGRNRVSLRNFFSQSFINTYTRRSQLYKPDEDSLAHTGINYFTEQTTFLNTQLSGEHALGGNGQFKMNWQGSYVYLRRTMPDERNFLLRQDSTNSSLFEIAHPQSPAYDPNSTVLNTLNSNFTNTGRQWQDVQEHDFTGSFDIHTPFDLWDRTQILSGGACIRTKYRVLSSDRYLVKGPGFFTLDQLLAPERYYPGGLTVINYYTNSPANPNFIYPSNRANYQASENLGAAWLSFENKFPQGLSLDWGFRLESGSQLVSNIRYIYTAGFKYPQVSTLDENTKILNTVFLPSVTAAWQPLHPVRIYASYFKTVNRPEVQELIPYRHYDATSFMITTGSANLAITHIDNFDAGISYQPTAGTRFAVSGAYKKLDQPIGYILQPFYKGNLISTPYNLPPTTVRSLTAEARLNFAFLSDAAHWLSYLSLFANGTWLKSNVSAGPIRNLGQGEEPTLSGSPAHTLNTGLVLQHPRLPMVTLIYSRIGDYIIASGSGTAYTVAGGNTVLAVPDYRMKDRDNLDIQVSQKILHGKMQIIAGINNLTNSSVVEYQDLNGNKKFDQPLSLALQNNSGGYFKDGVDNTVLHIKPQRSYFLTISYLFK